MRGMASAELMPRAIAALRVGRKDEGRRLLEEVLRADPYSERGWLWLSEAVDTDEERRFCVTRVLRINPDHVLARRGLQALGPGLMRSPLNEQPVPSEFPEPYQAMGDRRARDDWLFGFISQPVLPALGYLVALAAAEELTTLTDPHLGLAAYSGLLAGLILHTALTWRRPFYKLFLSLTVVPLIRLFSLSLPLAGLPLVYWYLVISLPLFVAAFLIARTVGFSRRTIGLDVKRLSVQGLVGLTGLFWGYVEYQILKPAPLIEGLTWGQIWFPALVLLICTGFAEELLFRGVMQRAATEAMGSLGGLYVAALFAVMHVGHRSWLDIPFVFGVALFFSWVVARTRSLLGVTLSHGLTNIMLFLIFPMLSPVGGG